MKRKVSRVLAAALAVLVSLVALALPVSAEALLSGDKYLIPLVENETFSVLGATEVSGTNIAFSVPETGNYNLVFTGTAVSAVLYPLSYELYTMNSGQKEVLSSQTSEGGTIAPVKSLNTNKGAGSLTAGVTYYLTYSVSVSPGLVNYIKLNCQLESSFSSLSYDQDGNCDIVLKSVSGYATDNIFGINLSPYEFKVPRSGAYRFFLEYSGSGTSLKMYTSSGCLNYLETYVSADGDYMWNQIARDGWYDYPPLALSGSGLTTVALYTLSTPPDLGTPITLIAGTRYRASVRYNVTGNGYHSARIVCRLVSDAVIDVSHKPGGGSANGGGASRRTDYIYKWETPGVNPGDPPIQHEQLITDALILDEKNKTITIPTGNGTKTFTYENFTYNPQTNTTSINTVTNDSIKITSTDNRVYIKVYDSSKNTYIYNYYYNTPEPPPTSSETSSDTSSTTSSDTSSGTSSEEEPGGGVSIFPKGLLDLILNFLNPVKDLLDGIKGFIDFLSSAFSFIPDEIWLLIGAGVTVAVVLRIMGR